jgi:hypothetical protein
MIHEISREQRDELVEALLKCPSIINRDTREAVVQDLPDDIQRNIRESAQLNVAVRNIVDTCLNFRNGIEDLIEIVRRYESTSLRMEELDQVWSRIAGPGWQDRATTYAELDEYVYRERRIHWNRVEVTAAFVGAIKGGQEEQWRVIAIQAPEDQGLDSLIKRFEEMCKTMRREATLKSPLLCARVRLAAKVKSSQKLATEVLVALQKAAESTQMPDEAQGFRRLQIDIERRSGEGPGRQSLTDSELADILCGCLKQVTKKPAVVVMLLENCEALLESRAGELLDLWLRHYACDVQGLVVVATAKDGLDALEGLEWQWIKLFNPPPPMGPHDFVAWAYEGYGLTHVTEAKIREAYYNVGASPKRFLDYLGAWQMTKPSQDPQHSQR